MAESVAYKLAQKLNKECNVSSKQFSDKVTDDPMEILSTFSKAVVGLKDLYLSNGSNNVRHFTFALMYGRAGYLGMKILDKIGHFFASDNSKRGEETKAESKADTAAWSAYKELQQEMDNIEGNENEKWNSIRTKIGDVWSRRFCR